MQEGRAGEAMPKSKTKRNRAGRSAARPAIAWGGKASPGVRRLNLALALVGAAAVVAAGLYWYLGERSERAFLALAAEGRGRLAEVVSEPDLGREHGVQGAAYSYPSRFPTSGAHDPIPAEPGFYRTQQSPGRLVHAVEHGHVVIYYDKPGAAALDRLEAWAGLYDGHWDGVVVTPMTGLGGKLVLTAWRKRLELAAFDAAAAAAFIDAYRGRGPENPVR